MPNTIHDTAVIEDSVNLGENVTVGPYCVLRGDVTIGDNCVLQSHVAVEGKTTMGKNNHIFPFAAIGMLPQDLKYSGEDTEVIIGDNNNIRESVTIHQGTEGGGNKTIIGSNNLLMAYVHIAHDCILGDNIVLSNSVQLAGHCILGDHAIIGGMTGLHHFTTVGAFAFIGGMSRVNKDVPPFMIMEGNPATIFGVNLVGLRRNKFSDEDISALKKAARVLYKAKHNVSQSIETIEADSELMTSKHVEELINALKKTAQGENGRALEAH